MPGSVFVSKTQQRPSLSSMISVREMPLHPKNGMGRDGHALSLLGSLLRNRSRADMSASAGGVFRMIVIEFVIVRQNLNHRESGRAVGAHNAHRKLDTVDELLDHGLVVDRERVSSAACRSPASRTIVMPSELPSVEGFTTQGMPHVSTISCISASESSTSLRPTSTEAATRRPALS